MSTIEELPDGSWRARYRHPPADPGPDAPWTPAGAALGREGWSLDISEPML